MQFFPQFSLLQLLYWLGPVLIIAINQALSISVSKAAADMDRIPELPLEPGQYSGSDEWAELADARRHINEQYAEYLAEERE